MQGREATAVGHHLTQPVSLQPRPAARFRQRSRPQYIQIQQEDPLPHAGQSAALYRELRCRTLDSSYKRPWPVAMPRLRFSGLGNSHSNLSRWPVRLYAEALLYGFNGAADPEVTEPEIDADVRPRS